MLALAFATLLTGADLQQWIQAQPQVRAYETSRAALGLQPPPADAFRQPPRLPQAAACRARSQALAAAVMLFRTADAGRIPLTSPQTGMETPVALDDAGKKALTDQAQGYELDAGRFEPSCLG